MWVALTKLFSANPYIPHGHCYLWQTSLVWLHLLSDSLIALAYYSIPLLLIYFVRKRKDVPFEGIFILFGVFIIACGTTHLMEVWTLWHPVYWLSGSIKAFTALVSCYTALELIPLLPQAIALPSPSQLEALNRNLENEIAERQQVEIALRQSQALFEAIFQAIPDAVVFANSNRQIVMLNPAFTILFGYKPEEMLGQQTEALYASREDYEEQGKKRFNLSAKEKLKHYEIKYRAKNSAVFIGETVGTPVKDTEGKILGFLGIIRDISDRKRAEQQLALQYLITRILSDSHTLAEATPKLLQAICESLEWDWGELWSTNQYNLDPQAATLQTTQQLRCVEIWHSQAIEVPEFEALTWQTSFLPGVGLPGRVWASGEPAWIEDVSCDPNFLRESAARQEGLHGAFAFPILFDDQILGVFAFFSRTSRQSEQDLLQLFKAIGTQIGQFIKRKRTEAAFRESEERLRLFIENVPSAIAMFDRQMHYLATSQRWLKDYHLEGEEIIGRSHYEVFPDIPERWKADHQRCLAGETQKCEADPFPRADGSLEWIKWELHPWHTASGTVGGIVMFTDVITERKETEEKLRVSKNALAQAQRVAHVGNWELDVATEKITWSEELFRIFGFDPADPEPAYREHFQYIDPEDGTLLQQSIDRAIAEGTPYEIELRIFRTDKAMRYLQARGEVIKDEQGQVIRLFGTALDITDRKQIEQELKESEAAIKAIYKVTSASNLDFEQKIKDLLVTGCQIFQLEFGILARIEGDRYQVSSVCCPDNSLCKGDVFDLKQTLCCEVLDTEDSLTIEHIGTSPWQDHPAYTTFGMEAYLGTRVWVANQVHSILNFSSHTPRQKPFKPTEKELLKLISRWIGNEIERQQAEQKLKTAIAELARSNEELEQFAYVASHDLQEPLRAVTSYAQLLAQRYGDQLDARADKYLTNIVEGGSRMQQLINDLLTYSRVGTRGKDFEPTSVEKVLQQALTNLKVAIQEKNAVITHDSLPIVIADESQLVQLFQNLISNALKFHGDEPPRIQVLAEQTDKAWVFAVRDHGIGIEPEYAERIFIIFQRLHTRSKYPGTGIGLAICKKIVQRHKGRIWLESEPGKGSTFYFTLPLSNTQTK